MKKQAVIFVLTLGMMQCGMGQTQMRAPAENKKPDPQQQAALVKRMAAEHAAASQAHAQALARVHARLAQTQLANVNRSKQLYSALSQRVKPAAQPAVQARLAKIQAANDELVRTQSPVELTGIWGRFTPSHQFVTQPPGCPSTPSITSLSVTSGQPGDPVWIHGNGFGANTTVTFLVGNGNKQTASIDYVDCTEMILSVPQVTGVPAYAGAVIVSNGSNQSAPAPFRFEPTIVTQQLPINNNNVTWADPSCPSNEYLGSSVFNAYEGYCGTQGGVGSQSFSGGLFAGGKDDDDYFSGYQLKNGWVLDTVDLASQNGTFKSSAGARVEGANIGSASPHVTVHSYVDAGNLESYSLTLYIHGPEGMPYQ
jgi:hypothetical protein